MNAHFLSDLNLRLIGPGRWETTTPLIYQSRLIPDPIVVAAEFVTDLASVPRRPFTFMLAGGRAPAPATVHDWLYQHPDFNSRSLADAILYEAMRVTQANMGLPEPQLVALAIWTAVRVAGWHAWRKDKALAGQKLNPIWTQEGWPAAPDDTPPSPA